VTGGAKPSAVDERSSRGTSAGFRTTGGGTIAAVAAPLGQYAQCDDWCLLAGKGAAGAFDGALR